MKADKLETKNRSGARGWRGFMVLVVLGSLAMGGMRVVVNRRARPNVRQQIAAKLVSWGLSLDGVVLPVDRSEADQWIAKLRSPISETRVQAAGWLASHGVRSSAGQIASSMDDPGTRRPCQLAKSLGSLGDDRWTNKLVSATRQTGNVDLQVCATLALGELQPGGAVGALIDAYRNNVAPTFALQALGRIADPASLDFLRSVAAEPRNRNERVLTDQAIQRVLVLQQPDPAAALIARLEAQSARGAISGWTIRKLASIGDGRAVTTIGEAFAGASRDEQVGLAGALLMHGEAGRAELRDLAEGTQHHGVKRPGAAIAGAALSLVVPETSMGTP